jgi:phospholipid/cholesterol/gamma-HCH transport system substrate-binding protein
MEREPRTELIVGIFVILGVGLFVAAFFLLGAENPVFERNYRLGASFADVSGLRAGASVRVAGMHAGQVISVEFPNNLVAKEIVVVMQINRRFQERIREDSVARIATEGLLGDKYIGISVGSPVDEDGNTIPVLEDGDVIDRINPKGMDDYMAKAEVILDNVQDATQSINVILEGPEGATAGQSLLEIVESIRHVILELEQGKGLIHELVYDKTAAANYRAAMSNLESTTARIDRLAEEIELGDGTVHALIYEDKAAEMIQEITAAADEIDGLVEDIKTREGLLHTIVYDEGEKNLLINLTEASANLREVSRMIVDGEGTLGALVTDPTVYEDLQTLLGRAERNKILKTYVRQSIRANEEAEGLRQEEPE